MSDPGSTPDHHNRLIYWLLGALIALIGMLSGIAHSAIMGQLGSIEQRIGRIEGLLLRVGG